MRKLYIMLLNNQYIREEKNFLKAKIVLDENENKLTKPEIHHKWL